MRKTLMIVATGLALALISYGQTAGDITGSVTDSSGGVVVGATVTVTNPQTNFTRQAITNSAGAYNFPALQPGIYNIRAENGGFQSEVRMGVELQVQQVARIDFALTVGAVAETVEVSGGASLVNTENATVGTVIENKRIVELPLNGRNFLSLVALSPNVSSGFSSFSGLGGGGANSRQGGDRALVSISVAGQRREFNNYSIDGVTNTDVSYNLYLFLPSIDAIQEFKVVTGIYSAEFGRGVGQINVSTKGGTNQYHGTVFEFFRNSKMDARPYAFTSNSPTQAPLKWNQYGFTLGGPIQIPKVFNGKNRLFFMSNYEGFRERQQTQTLVSMPPVAMRNGNFSQLLPNTVIVNPLNRNAAGTKLPFPGNIIPSTQFHPVAVKLLEFFPAPNIAGAGLSNNYLQLDNVKTDKDQFSQRIDFVESVKSNWYGRYSWSDDNYITPALYQNGTILDAIVQQAMISNIRILSPTLVNEARFGVNGFFNNNLDEQTYKRDVMSELGIGFGQFGPFDYGAPAVSITGYTGAGPSPESPYQFRNYNFDWVDNLAWTRGTHSIKIGADIRRDRFNTHGNYGTRGQLTFQNQATGYGFADFLTGYLNQTLHSVSQVSTQFRDTSQFYFISDNWKVRPNLTIDIGLRYEYVPPWSDKNDMYANVKIPYIAYTPGTAAGQPHPTLCRVGSGDFYQGTFIRFNPAIQVARGCMGDRLIAADYKNFAPRLGIAWSPTPKWTVRSGIGMFYVQDIGNMYFDVSRNMAGRLQVNANTTTNNLTLSDPSNLLTTNACGTSYPLVCISTPGLLAAQYDRRTPYVIQYEMNIQRQLGNSTVAEVGYFGSESHFLQRFHNLNNPIPGTGATAPRTPWPELSQIQYPDGDVNANYQSLAAKLTHRLTKGLTYLVGYTFSKAMDDGSGIRAATNDAAIQNSWCVQCEHGLSPFDQRHRFVTSILYQLPAGKGHRMFASGIANQALGGWQLSSIITKSTGSPLGIATGTNRSGTTLADRPNATGQSVALSNPTTADWFNLNAFSENAIATFGNVGRNVATGPGIFGWDFSALKNFDIRENTYLQFRFEAFDAGNHPNFADPGLGLTSNALTSAGVAIPGTGTFGVISGTRSDMRELQLALKLVF